MMINRHVCLRIFPALALFAAACATESDTTRYGTLTAVSTVSAGAIETVLRDGATVVGTMSWDLATNEARAILPNATHEMTLVGRDQTGRRANEVLYNLSTVHTAPPSADAAQEEAAFRLGSSALTEEEQVECWDTRMTGGCSRCCDLRGHCCQAGSKITCEWYWDLCTACTPCQDDHGYCGEEYCGCGSCCGTTCCI